MIGKTISHFKVLEKLGGGGMGVVYLAEDTRLKRTVALKFLPPHLSTDEEAKSRFVQEAQSASALNHANICAIHDVGETDDGQTFIAMAHYEGQTLKERLEEGTLEVGEATDIARQIAEGLGAAHEKGIVHRDIKPANILITNRGRAIILDFGLAKLTGSLDLTKSGFSLGTPHYMSPEQVRAEHLDRRTDIWSLGVVLYEMLTGKRPFKGEYEQALSYSILNEDPDPVEVLKPETPATLGALVKSLLQKEQGERLSSAADASEQLHAVLSELSSASSGMDATAVYPVPRRPRSWRIPVATALVLASLVLVWILVGNRATTTQTNISFEPAPAIAVLPFDVEGDDHLEYLRNGMVRLLSARLDGMGEIRSIDPNAVFAHIERNLTDAPVLDIGIGMAQRFDAAHFVLGSVLRVGGLLQMSASLYSPDGRVLKDAVVDVAADSLLLSGVDELAKILLADRLSTGAWELSGIAAATTTSFKALRHYLRGEEAMRDDDYLTATDEFWSAVTGDSTFALAWYRLAHATGWLGIDSLESAYEALGAARRLGQNLPRVVRQTFEAEHLSKTGRAQEGIELLEEIVSQDPENVLAWLELGDLQYHYNPFLGRAAADGRYALERALDLDPDLVEASQHLFRFVEREGDYARAESLAVHMRFQGYLQPGDTIALKIVSAKDSISRQRVIEDLRDVPATDLRIAVAMLSYLFERPEMAERVVPSLLQAQGRDSDDCLSGTSVTYWLHEAAFARGRVQSALSLLATRGIEWRRQMQRLASLLVYYPFSDSSLTKIETLATSANVQCSDTIVSLQSTKDFIRGLVAWRMDDSGKLENAIHSLDAASDSLLPDNLEVVFGRTLRAVALWSAGQGDRALESLDSALVPITATYHYWDFYSQTIQRFIRAEILFSEGRYDEAVDWYASVNDGPHIDNGFALFPPATFRRAQAHDMMGDTDDAIRLYTRSIEIWDVADEELQPWVTEAKESLERLLKAEAQEPS